MSQAFPADMDQVAEIVGASEKILADSHINKKLLDEYRLLIEEIVLKLIENSKPGSEITVTRVKRIGGVNIKIGCPGTPIVLGEQDEMDIGGRIIEEYSDYLRQSYSSGTNYITFTTSYDSTLLLSVGSLVLSVVVALLLGLFFDGTQIEWINDNLIYPCVIIFTRALQTMALPAAFFSLASFLVTLNLSLDKDLRIKRLFFRYFGTSLVAIGVGAICWAVYRAFGFLTYDLTAFSVARENFMGQSVQEFLTQTVSSNIIDPFIVTNPLPMLIIAVLLGFGAASFFGPEGDTTRKAISSINGLFCRALNIVYSSIPIFLFFALLTKWLSAGAGYALVLLSYFGMLILPLVLMFVVYAIQMILSGVNPITFVKDYAEVILENLRIGSNIQALPYNKRMIYRKTKMQSGLLREGLNLGTLMNMDGNCMIISTTILVLLTCTGVQLSVVQVISMLFIIILLSVGAPNQPGSFQLSMIVLMAYVGISGDLYGDILIIEAFTGKLYSCVNALGDIVTMVMESHRLKKSNAN